MVQRYRIPQGARTRLRIQRGPARTRLVRTADAQRRERHLCCGYHRDRYRQTQDRLGKGTQAPYRTHRYVRLPEKLRRTILQTGRRQVLPAGGIPMVPRTGTRNILCYSELYPRHRPPRVLGRYHRPNSRRRGTCLYGG